MSNDQLSELESFIGECLNDFYESRIKKIDEIKLKIILRRKNPYLFKALNTERASEIIERIVSAFISSSDEAVFGDKFFEPIAKKFSGGVISPSEGVDVAVENDNKYTAYAVKSGPNPFNSSAKKRQNDEFASLRSRLMKLHKQFDPVLAYSYGSKISPSNEKKIYRETSGKAFWHELTGDPEFYVKLITLMKDIPKNHMDKYKPKYDQALNRLTIEFAKDFCFQDGRINWEKLVEFVSDKKPRGKTQE
jgi:hypothetical protein